MHKRLMILAVALSGLFCASWADTRFIRIIFPDGDSINAELAVTLAERARGLMFRDKLEWDQGMLFVFEEEDFHSFWMKNCLISLDLLWLDRHKRIIHIEKDVPPCHQPDCPSYTPRFPGLYVLELRQGSVEKRGLRLYDRIDFVLKSTVRMSGEF